MFSVRPTALPARVVVALELAAIAVIAVVASRSLLALPIGEDALAGLFNGPDAGEWALNARLVSDGEFGAVDSHRMPTFLLLLALSQLFEPDIARAGHLVLVGAWMVTVVAVYALGRAAGGRAVGFVASLLVLGCAPILHSAAKFGVDPVVAMMLPLALASVVPVRRAWPMALGAGVVGGFATVTHLTALPFMAPAVLLLWMRGRGPEAPRWQGVAALGLYALGAALVLGGLGSVFRLIGPSQLIDAVSEGIATRAGESVPVDSQVLSTPALGVLEANAGGALSQAAHAALRPFYWPGMVWPGLFVVFAVGVFGPGLGPGGAGPTGGVVSAPVRFPGWLHRRLRPASRRRLKGRITGARRFLQSSRPAHALRWLWRFTDLPHGLPLLACLTPLVVFAAASAEPRYSQNLLPFAAILLARGLVAPLRALAGRGAATGPGRTVGPASRARPWVAGALAGLGAMVLVHWVRGAQTDALHRMPAGDPVAASAVELAAAIRQHFPDDSAVATPLREAAAHLGRPFCPRSSCTYLGDEKTIKGCVAKLQTECQGEGPIPLVWFQNGPLGMGDDRISQAVGAWCAENYPVLARVETFSFEAVLIAIPRPEPGAADGATDDGEFVPPHPPFAEPHPPGG
jgi:hypothetical protein